MGGMIDLHVHSTFSDGSNTPRELAEKAKQAGLTAIALTDHDNTDGVDIFIDACNEFGLTGVSGVEISVDVPKGTMHILGYLFDQNDVPLQSALKLIRGGRSDRNRKILDRLNEIGLDLTWDEVADLAGGDVVGRPHFAMAMVARNYVSSKNVAFDLYLGKGKQAYVDRFRLSPQDGINVIANAGGVAVLAHPFTLELDKKAMRDCIRDLKEAGMKGIEVYYSEHSNGQVKEYMKLAREFGLIVTGGSDFHGKLNPAVHLGRGFGSLYVPDELMDDLRVACAKT